MADLKPCPFCGGEATLKVSTSKAHTPKRAKEKMWLVSCLNLCEMRPRTPPQPTSEHAHWAWNRRAK